MNDIHLDALQSILKFIDNPEDWKNVNAVSKKWKRCADRIKNDKAKQFSKIVMDHKRFIRENTYESLTYCYYVLPNRLIHGKHVTVKKIRKRFGFFEKPSIIIVKRFEFGKDITSITSITSDTSDTPDTPITMKG